MLRSSLLLIIGLFIHCSFLWAQHPALNIGTTWTYEVVEPIAVTTYKTYEIVELTTWQDSSAYVIEDTDTGSLDYMHVVGGKVYFWNQDAERYELHFDYGATQAYSAQWMGVCHEEDGIATANIDSLAELEISGDILTLQHLSIANNGSFVHDMPASIYGGIGNDESLKLQLGYGLCDSNTRTTKLRCFTNGEVSYNFVDYPCDTTFLISTTTEALTSDIIIYPNPSTGIITIDYPWSGQDMPYRVYNLLGNLVMQGVLESNTLYISQPGSYLLVVQLPERLWKQKVIIKSD